MDAVPASENTFTSGHPNQPIAEWLAAPEITELRHVSVLLAETAATHVRTRRPEVFGSTATCGAGAVRAKSTPTDPVTVVDTEAEHLVRRLLSELRPGDSVVGEEGGGRIDECGGVQWVVDPIDGTVNFLYGIPAYSVSIAAICGGRPVAGAVADIARTVTYSAGLGVGAHRSDAYGTSIPLHCNEVDSIAMSLVATGFGYGPERRARQGELVTALLPHIRDIRRMGSAALDLCMVASGQVDAHYEHGLNLWDWAAGALIAAEAGARLILPALEVVGAAGELVVAAAPGIAEELADLLGDLGITDPIPEP